MLSYRRPAGIETEAMVIFRSPVAVHSLSGEGKGTRFVSFCRNLRNLCSTTTPLRTRA